MLPELTKPTSTKEQREHSPGESVLRHACKRIDTRRLCM